MGISKQIISMGFLERATRSMEGVHMGILWQCRDGLNLNILLAPSEAHDASKNCAFARRWQRLPENADDYVANALVGRS